MSGPARHSAVHDRTRCWRHVHAIHCCWFGRTTNTPTATVSAIRSLGSESCQRPLRFDQYRHRRLGFPIHESGRSHRPAHQRNGNRPPPGFYHRLKRTESTLQQRSGTNVQSSTVDFHTTAAIDVAATVAADDVATATTTSRPPGED